MRRPHEIITLFSESKEPSLPAASLYFSGVIHATLILSVAVAVINRPQIREAQLRYTLRQLELHDNAPEKDRSANKSDWYPDTSVPREDGQNLRSQSARMVADQHLPQKPSGQLLVQPAVVTRTLPVPELLVPKVVVWTPEMHLDATIVPSLPHQPAASRQPTMQAPNQEHQLADMPLASVQLTARIEPVQAATTFPIRLPEQANTQAVPVMTSSASAKPAAGAVVSLSDLRMQDGKIVLAAVNQMGSGNAHSAGAQPIAQNGSASAANGSSGHGDAAGAAEGKPGSDSGPGANAAPVRIHLPKDGQFGSVVVGTSLEDQFPETADLWAGRLAYTVYLHVGLAKSWILQFALSQQADAEQGGKGAAVDAPWPYSMLRPDVPSDELNADALIVRGTINAAGRFEGLGVSFPPAFPRTAYVLKALEQWEFRPATQNGKPTRVDVMLIIPDEEQ
jgi:hypothetical protein